MNCKGEGGREREGGREGERGKRGKEKGMRLLTFLLYFSIIERPKSQDQPRPFKAGRAKPRPHPPHKLGCPVYPH